MGRFPDKNYSDYLKSAEWRAWRELYFSVHPKVCAVCRATSNIQLHHRQYDNPKSRRFKDYSPLCKSHHDDLTKLWRENRGVFGMNLDQFTSWYIKSRRGRSHKPR